MAHSYYQRSVPGWGTNQFQFGPPPAPTFQPQPSWGGMDYYRAHATSPDPSLFDYALNRVRDYGSSANGTSGVGIHEARHWHRRAYGGLGELEMMSPTEIGHAAAYEAYRTWIHNSSIYEPISGDIERQQEGLIGLAVAEATRLLQFANRTMDRYAGMAASEAAAHTASLIFYQSREGHDHEHRSRSQYRRGSFDEPYAFDDEMAYPRGRSRSRHRSHSRHSSYGGGIPPPVGMSMAGTPYSSSGALPGVAHSFPGVAHSGYSGQSGSYGSYSGSYGGGGMPMSGGIPMSGSIPMSGGISPYPSPGIPITSTPSYSGMPMGMSPSASFHGSYPGSSGMVIPMGHRGRSRSSSFSYPQQPYMGTAMSGASMGIPQGQTIIIQKPRKHRHRHHHHSRGRSSERY